MIDAQFTYFDATVLAIMSFSCLFAFFRGFVKEILSLGAWIGAGIVTLYWFRDMAEILKPHVKSDMVSGGLSALGLYVGSLIIFSMINSMIVRVMKEGGDVGVLDNMLGLFFGAFRGAFIISLAYLLMMTAVTEDTAPDWLKQAHTKKYAEYGAILLGRASPDYIVELTSIKDKILDEKSMIDTDSLFSDFGEEQPDQDELKQRKQDEDDLDSFIDGL